MFSQLKMKFEYAARLLQTANFKTCSFNKGKEPILQQDFAFSSSEFSRCTI